MRKDKTTTDVTDKAGFGLADLLALPEFEQRTETKTFTARGCSWPITLRCLADDASAEEYFDVANVMSASGGKPEPIVFHLPPPDVKEIRVTDAGYVTSLRFLASLSVAPAFDVNAWAIFGHKNGGRVMNEIFGWAADINGMAAPAINEGAAEAKNE